MLLQEKKSRTASEYPSLLSICLILIVGSCGSVTDAIEELKLQGYWQLLHLEGSAIYMLEPDEEGLFVGTEAGLFQLKGTELVQLGLEEQAIIGAVRLKDGGILASVQASYFSTGDTTLFKTLNEGESWEPFLNNFGGEEGRYTWIESGPVAASRLSDTLFIGGGWTNIIYSLNGGQDWTSVGNWDSWGGYGGLLHIDPWHEGRIWVGGISPLSEVILWKINDYGKGWDEWSNISEGLSPNIEAAAYDVITHPDNPDWVMVGLGWAARKTTDGGQSWRTSLEETGVRAFARSVLHPDVIYAGGWDASGKLFLAATTDFGETWEKEIFEEGPSQIITNDLSVQITDGQETVFLGTNQGVYSITVDQ
jgi:hypothetical protein